MRPTFIMTPEEFYHTVRPALDSGRAVSFPATGRSMLPFIRHGMTVTLRQSPSYFPGDVVLAITSPRRRAVLHYIVKADRHGYTLMGAGNLVQTEWCRREDVAARVDTPILNRKRILLWHRLLPLRRYFLWLYRRKGDL